MPVRTSITLDINAPNTWPRTRDEWPADRPSTRCRPRRAGGRGSPPSEPRPTRLITDGGLPATVFLLTAVSLLGGTGTACRRFPSSQTNLASQPYRPVITAAGVSDDGGGRARVPSTAARRPTASARPLRAVSPQAWADDVTASVIDLTIGLSSFRHCQKSGTSRCTSDTRTNDPSLQTRCGQATGNIPQPNPLRTAAPNPPRSERNGVTV
jgi:hypothetical protein